MYDTTDLKSVFKEFNTENINALVDLQSRTNMEDEHLANVAATVISNAMTNSIEAIRVLRQFQSQDIDDTIKQDQSAKDLLLKDAQISNLDAEVGIKAQELLIKEKEVLIKDKELLMEQAKLDMAEQELLMKEKDLLIKDKELDIAVQEIALKTEQIDIMTREIVLKESESVAQIAAIEAETAIKAYQLTDMLPQEKAKMAADVTIAEKEILVRTKEVDLKQAQIDISAQEIILKTEQIDVMTREIVLKESESVAQIAAIEADTLVKTSQKSMIDQQKLTEAQQTAKATYEVTDILPIQKTIYEEQVNTEVAKQNSMGIEDTVKKSQKSMIDQQKLTEVQNTLKEAYNVTTYLPAQKGLVEAQELSEIARKNTMIADTNHKDSQRLLIDQQRLTEAEETIKRANEALYVSAQKDAILQQKLSEAQRTAQEAYKASTLLPDEHTYNAARTTATVNQGLLHARQTVGFDDKKRVEKAEKISNAVGMIYASGGDVPPDAWQLVKDAANAI